MKKILVVDDQPFAIKLLTAMLKPKNFDIVSARHGIEAVEKYRAERPDVVLMDILMPHMDGIEATRTIREEFSDAKILMCTALDQIDIMQNALDAGALGYIMKPFQAKDVVAKINEVLGT
jgi:two-component system chemotaxis response regulator CheY